MTRPSQNVFIAAALFSGLLALSACSGAAAPGGAAGSGSAESDVPFGASKDEYIAAFESIDPIHVFAQSPGPKGPETYSGWKDEAFFAAIEEWSGGKITFEIGYSYAIAPLLETDDALIEGRLDIATVLPPAEPTEYPVYAEFAKGAALAKDGSPLVGALHVNAFMLDVGYQIPELAQEFEDQGMHLLIPSYNLVPGSISCAEERIDPEDWAGAVTAANGPEQVAVIDALGGAPTSFPFNEVFEGLQRGAMDCATAAVPINAAYGLTEVAPYVMVAGETAVPSTPGALALNKDFWDGLPALAQQLFYDRIADSYIDPAVGGMLVESGKAVTIAEEHGGGVVQLSEDSQELVARANEKLVESIADSSVVADPSGLVDKMRDASEKWLTIVTEDLGYDPDLTFDELPAWLETNGGEANIDKYIETVHSEIFSKNGTP